MNGTGASGASSGGAPIAPVAPVTVDVEREAQPETEPAFDLEKPMQIKVLWPTSALPNAGDLVR